MEEETWMIDDLVAPEVDTPAPRRRRLRWSFVAAGLAVAAAVAYLIYANTTTSAAYYMTVKELRGCHDCAGRIVRVAGTVQPGTVARDDQTQTVRFTIDDGQNTLPVTYSGIVPDIFRPGVTVVVEGTLPAAAGVFHASTLLTKCPSKFQSATPTGA
jgi:cytochrome c-type biogenesis protein CcmE